MRRVVFDRETTAVIKSYAAGGATAEDVQQALFDQEFRRVTHGENP